MKWSRTADGQRRLWFADDEIEQIMSDELRKAELFPSAERPVVDLERFGPGTSSQASINTHHSMTMFSAQPSSGPANRLGSRSIGH